MATKVTADPSTRIFTFTDTPVNGQVIVDAVVDFYSALKDEWLAGTAGIDKNKFPMRSFGDEQGSGQIGPYVFVDNVLQGWRLQPHDSDHELFILGNVIGESAVQGLVSPLWLTRPGRTIVIREVQSAQALTRQTGISGLTAGESQIITNTYAEQIRLRKINGNEIVINKTLGKVQILEDDDLAVYQEANAFEDEAKTIPLGPNSKGIDARERFIAP